MQLIEVKLKVRCKEAFIDTLNWVKILENMHNIIKCYISVRDRGKNGYKS